MNCIVIVEKNDNKIENSSLECVSIANKISENVIVVTDIQDEKIVKSINADTLLVIDDIEKKSNTNSSTPNFNTCDVFKEDRFVYHHLSRKFNFDDSSFT